VQILQTVWTTRFCCVAGWMLNLSAFMGGFPCCSETISPQLALDLLFKAVIFFLVPAGCVLYNDLTPQTCCIDCLEDTDYSLARPRTKCLKQSCSEKVSLSEGNGCECD